MYAPDGHMSLQESLQGLEKTLGFKKGVMPVRKSHLPAVDIAQTPGAIGAAPEPVRSARLGKAGGRDARGTKHSCEL